MLVIYRQTHQNEPKYQIKYSWNLEAIGHIDSSFKQEWLSEGPLVVSLFFNLCMVIALQGLSSVEYQVSIKYQIPVLTLTIK